MLVKVHIPTTFYINLTAAKPKLTPALHKTAKECRQTTCKQHCTLKAPAVLHFLSHQTTFCTQAARHPTTLALQSQTLMLSQRPTQQAAAPGPWTTPTATMPAARLQHACWGVLALRVHLGSDLRQPAGAPLGQWLQTPSRVRL